LPRRSEPIEVESPTLGLPATVPRLEHPWSGCREELLQQTEPRAERSMRSRDPDRCARRAGAGVVRLRSPHSACGSPRREQQRPAPLSSGCVGEQLKVEPRKSTGKSLALPLETGDGGRRPSPGPSSGDDRNGGARRTCSRRNTSNCRARGVRCRARRGRNDPIDARSRERRRRWKIFYWEL
jgi:hypothetical protein